MSRFLKVLLTAVLSITKLESRTNIRITMTEMEVVILLQFQTCPLLPMYRINVGLTSVLTCSLFSVMFRVS